MGEFEGENFCPRAEAPPHRPETSWAEPRRNFPFLFEFFRGGAQKKNCKGKFLRGCRRSVSEGGWRGAWNVSQDSAGSKSELFDIMTTRQKIAKALNISLEDLII